jgi:hypothetical protein
MTEYPATYWLTDDVYDPCDHGVNAAVDTCQQCEDDIADIRIVNGEIHITDVKRVVPQ